MKAYNLKTALQNPLEVTELFIYRGNLEAIPEQIFQFKNLQKLDLGGNKITQIPDDIIQLQKLEYLNLAANKITHFSENLKELSALKYVSLTNANLDFFPEFLLHLSNLETLFLSTNKISKLPKTLKKLAPKLKQLHLNSNSFTTFQQPILNLKNLETLDLGMNKISRIPQKIDQLKQLKFLFLNKNRIKELPQNISELCALEKINLKNNKLENVDFLFEKMSELELLNLSYNKLNIFPKGILKFKKLRRLYLSANKIEELPENIDALQSLRILFLHKNKLSKFPQSFRNLQNLEQLDLIKNPISKIPIELLFLKNLKNLTVNKQVPGNEILRFLRTQKKGDLPERLFEIAINSALGKVRGVSLISEADLFLLINFQHSKVATFAKEEILKRHFSKRVIKLKKGEEITILGKTNFLKKEIKERIESLGFQFSNILSNKTKIVVLGIYPNQDLKSGSNNFRIISERDLNVFLQNLEQPHLFTADEQELENLSRLLLSNQKENVEIAIQILKSGGIPSELLTNIFIAFKKTVSPSQERQLKRFLELNLSPKARKLMSFRKNFLKPEAIEKKVLALTKNIELDGKRIFEEVFKEEKNPDK